MPRNVSQYRDAGSVRIDVVTGDLRSRDDAIRYRVTTGEAVAYGPTLAHALANLALALAHKAGEHHAIDNIDGLPTNELS